MRPQFDTMAMPPRLPLVILTEARDATFRRDSGLVNCYLERTLQDEIIICKRAGYTYASAIAGPGTVGNGAVNWGGDVYTIFDGTLYRNGTSVGTGLDQSGGIYRFSAIRGATPKLILGNGAKSYAYTVAGGLTSDLHTVDADFPATTVKGIEYLNGALYVMTSNGDIYNSGTNTHSSWGTLDFLNAQSDPDAGVALAKQSVYLIALGEISVEAFYDNGNPSGSPLAPAQGSKIDYGCKNADSMQEIGDTIIWLSSTKSSQVQVSMLNNLQHTVISTPDVDRLIEGCTTSTVYSLSLRISGHVFYVLTFYSDNLTLVYDLKEQLWHRWSDPQGDMFPFVAATYDSSGRLILQHRNNGTIYYMDSDTYMDDQELMSVDIYTPNFDANTVRRKLLNVLSVVGDQTVGSILEVRCSDNDRLTWTNFRKIDMSRKLKQITNCGSFVSRAYHFRHRANTPFRIKAVDVAYDVGTL